MTKKAKSFRRKKSPGVVERVLDALRSSEFEYRTAKAIANQTHLTVEQVEDVLMSHPEVVRVSVIRRPDGSMLFADRDRVSALKDAWAGFRAVSFEKFK